MRFYTIVLATYIAMLWLSMAQISVGSPATVMAREARSSHQDRHHNHKPTTATSHVSNESVNIAAVTSAVVVPFAVLTSILATILCVYCCVFKYKMCSPIYDPIHNPPPNCRIYTYDFEDLQTISQLSSNGQSQTTEQTLIGETIGKGPPTYYQVVTSPNITDDNSTSTEEEVPAYNTLSEEQLPQYQEVASC